MSEQEEFEFRLRLEQEQGRTRKPMETSAYEREAMRTKMFRDEIMTSPPMALARGIKDVIDTGAIGLATVYDKVTGVQPGEAARVRAMNEAGRAEFDAAANGRVMPAVARIGGNLAATAPAVRALGGLTATAAPRLGSAIGSSGFTTGAAPVGALARAGDMGIRTVGGGIAGGLSAGLVNPDDAGAGATIGAALPGVGAIAGATGRTVGKALRPNVNNPELAKRAIQEFGIPLGPADISASKGTKALRSVLNDAPFVGGIGERQAQAVQSGFNRAVGKTFGADAPSLTPEVLDAAKKRMGAEFDRIWGQNALTVDVKFAQDLAALKSEVDKLPQGEGARLRSWLEDVASKVVDDGAGNVTIPGDVANRLQSKLGAESSKAQGFLKSALSDLRSSMIGAFNRGVSPEDAAALASTKKQYKAFKTVQPLLEGAEAGVAGRTVGDVPAGLLPQAVRQSYKGNIQGSPLGDLSQIGSQYIADRVARTGGGPRAMIQNSALGGALAYGAITNPLALAALPAGAAAQKALGSPTVANLLMRQGMGTPAVVNALMNPDLQRAVYLAAPLTGSAR